MSELIENEWLVANASDLTTPEVFFTNSIKSEPLIISILSN